MSGQTVRSSTFTGPATLPVPGASLTPLGAPAAVFQEIPVEFALIRTDTSLTPKRANPSRGGDAKPRDPRGQPGCRTKEKHEMSARRRARLDGWRWFLLGVFTPDSRGRCAAASWLMDDPVFSARRPVPTRRRLKLVPGRPA